MNYYIIPAIGRKVFLYSVTTVITSEKHPLPPPTHTHTHTHTHRGFQIKAQFPGEHDKQERRNHSEETDPKLATSSKHMGGGGREVEFIKGSSA